MPGSVRWLLVGLLGLPLWAGCAVPSLRSQSPPRAPAARTVGIQDEAAMKSAIDALVPAGMSLTQAEQVLRGEGFTCTFGHNDLTGQDHLTCTRSDTQALWLATRWVVTLDFRDGVILGSQVKRGFVGP